jgi:hypothetical protein
MKNFFFLVLLFACVRAQAQSVILDGVVCEKSARNPVINANITLTRSRTSTQFHSHTVANGSFEFMGLAPDTYTIKIVCVGYQDFEKKIALTKARERIDTLFMVQKPVELSGVEVVSVLAPIELKKDTIQFNAGAFKSNPDASAEDLIKKMPGISMDNTSVKAQGETVQQVLVDGKQFFGDDPFIAMRNMPADVIDKVQVYDKLSDQAELTGFDDGQSIKTINIITKANRRNGQFGKLYAGVGEDQRYQTGGSMNSFSGEQRITVLGLGNNTNQQNFSAQDFLGAMGNSQRSRGGMGGMGPVGGGRGSGRGGGGGALGGYGSGGFGGPGQAGAISNFFIGQQNGINTTNSLGLNYTDEWMTGLSVSGSYFFNLSDNRNNQTLNRDYTTSLINNQQYDENDVIDNRNYNHRLNLRMEYTIDSSNAVIFNPRLSFQTNHADTRVFGTTSFPVGGVYSNLNTGDLSSSNGNNLSGALTFRHKFSYPGRTLSLGINSSSNSKHVDETMQSRIAYSNVSTIDSLDQQTLSSIPGYTLSSNLAYTEPVMDNGLLQVNYAASQTRNQSDKRLSMMDPRTAAFDVVDTALSNSLDNSYITQRYGLGYLNRGSNYNVNVQMAMQNSRLQADYSFPTDRTLERSFVNFVPTALIMYRMNPSNNFRLLYRASTTPPSVTQLQSTVDNSNPALPTAGNPDLKQSYNNSFTARYSYIGPMKSNSFFALVSASFTNDYIANATFLFPHDTVFFGSTLLKTGTQLTQPVNLNGYQNINTFLTYGLPIDYIKSSINMSSGVTYSRTPGMVNSDFNVTKNIGLTEGAVLASNINENVDFTLVYNYSYNTATTTLQSQPATTYTQQTGELKTNFIFLGGFVFRNDVSYQWNTGSGSGYDQHFVLWNLGFAKKFLADQSLEVALNAYDVLNQNSKINRTVTESYIEDTRPEVLRRYVILVVTYTLKNRPF